MIDDASRPAWSAEIAEICRPHRDRVTFVRRRRRVGLLANTVEAVRNRCADPATVIVTLDADDCLIGASVLSELAARYAEGADVTIGSMLRTDKHRRYPVSFLAPRRNRGGNVWQHLRSFGKALFDAVPDEALRIDGQYVDVANDWAYMLPIVELADRPVHIERPLYHYERGTHVSESVRSEREAVISHLVGRAQA